MFMIKHVWLDVLTTLNLLQVAELSVKMNV